VEVLFVDILIEHIIHVKIVLQKLHEAGLEVKLSKCMFTDIFYETMVLSSTRVKTKKGCEIDNHFKLLFSLPKDMKYYSEFGTMLFRIKSDSRTC